MPRSMAIARRNARKFLRRARKPAKTLDKQIDKHLKGHKPVNKYEQAAHLIQKCFDVAGKFDRSGRIKMGGQIFKWSYRAGRGIAYLEIAKEKEDARRAAVWRRFVRRGQGQWEPTSSPPPEDAGPHDPLRGGTRSVNGARPGYVVDYDAHGKITHMEPIPGYTGPKKNSFPNPFDGG